jgi:dynein heavy chain, axonemal
MQRRIIAEFDHVAERALREVETTEQLMDMIQFIETARTAGMIKLNARVKVSNNIFCDLIINETAVAENFENSKFLNAPSLIKPSYEAVSDSWHYSYSSTA